MLTIDLPPGVEQGLPDEVRYRNVLVNGNEACVICGEDTGISARTPVELRSNYFDTAGQCCASCAHDVRWVGNSV